jgi:hypothetical protein
MNLIDVLGRLYDSEINFKIACFWDSGIHVMLGDQINGYRAARSFEVQDLGEVAAWLDAEARRCFPYSDYARNHGREG